ncbi:hypothetical protein GCM10023321_84240 [Pseudonocardia eucalypti]|uniref:Uncharacterized protein n=2 Tax=Pseudonocardia eucalypti TaxID=648755 RepID=A0ABP9RFA0_9PSEU
MVPYEPTATRLRGATMLKRLLVATLSVTASALLGIGVVTAAPAPTEYAVACYTWCYPSCFCAAPPSNPEA